MTLAHRSHDGWHVECGLCGAELCRRQRITESSVRRSGYYLVWDDTWILAGDHVERSAGAVRRLAEGHEPQRRPWLNEDRIALSRALISFVPARCDGCGEMNEINRKRLDVLGVASHSR